ncbi:MAG: DUF6485 family protein [Phycisphaerae bacterium]|nr:DUF6485 family protein [Phycisphaerae bacterium]
MECKKADNKDFCNCTYSCGKKGMCCDCLQYHLGMKQLPACCFPPEAEATYDRSFRKFAEAWNL